MSKEKLNQQICNKINERFSELIPSIVKDDENLRNNLYEHLTKGNSIVDFSIHQLPPLMGQLFHNFKTNHCKNHSRNEEMRCIIKNDFVSEVDATFDDFIRFRLNSFWFFPSSLTYDTSKMAKLKYDASTINNFFKADRGHLYKSADRDKKLLRHCISEDNGISKEECAKLLPWMRTIFQ